MIPAPYLQLPRLPETRALIVPPGQEASLEENTPLAEHRDVDKWKDDVTCLSLRQLSATYAF